MAADRKAAKLRERRDVLLALAFPFGWQVDEVRQRAGLDTQHANVTLGHLRKLRTDGLADRNRVGRWSLTWPAGHAAAEMLLLTMQREAR